MKTNTTPRDDNSGSIRTRIAKSALAWMIVAATFATTGCATGVDAEDADYDETTQEIEEYGQVKDPGEAFRALDQADEDGEEFTNPAARVDPGQVSDAGMRVDSPEFDDPGARVGEPPVDADEYDVCDEVCQQEQHEMTDYGQVREVGRLPGSNLPDGKGLGVYDPSL